MAKISNSTPPNCRITRCVPIPTAKGAKNITSVGISFSGSLLKYDPA
ncbi:MAG: hypothetical protein K2P17_03375 [Helicobacteraceae bacterium]|nr:hypothetical protein [Helicobacteraceae bacterium]